MRAAIFLTLALLFGASPGPLVAQSVFVGEDANGTITFTDRASDAAGFATFWDDINDPHRPKQLHRNIDLFDRQIRAASRDAGISPALLKAIVAAESGFNPRAVSPAGAQGLAQLMPATAKSLGVIDSFDPSENLNGAARLMKTLLKRFGSTDLALAAYNAGPRRVVEAKGVPEIAETQRYVEKVKALFQYFQFERPVSPR